MCGSKCCNHENISLKHEEPDRFDRSQVLFLKEFIFFYYFYVKSKLSFNILMKCLLVGRLDGKLSNRYMNMMIY